MDRAEAEKERILSSLLRIMSGAGILAYAPSAYFAWKDELPGVLAADTAAYAAIVAAAFLPGLSYRARLFALAATCLALGAAVTAGAGAAGAGFVWFAAGIVLAALFGSAAAAVASFAATGAFLAAYAAALALGFPGRGYAPESMAIIGGNLLVVCLALVLVIRRIRRSLEGALAEADGLSRRLEIELGESRTVRDRLSAALEAKEGLVRELHHRVNNNMQVVLSVLEMGGNLADRDARGRVAAVAAAVGAVMDDPDAAGADLPDLARRALAAEAGVAGTAEPRLDADSGPYPRADNREAALVALCAAELFRAVQAIRARAAGLESAELVPTGNGAVRLLVALPDEDAARSAAARLSAGPVAEAAAGFAAFGWDGAIGGGRASAFVEFRFGGGAAPEEA